MKHTTEKIDNMVASVLLAEEFNPALVYTLTIDEVEMAVNGYNSKGELAFTKALDDSPRLNHDDTFEDAVAHWEKIKDEPLIVAPVNKISIFNIITIGMFILMGAAIAVGGAFAIVVLLR